VESQNVFSDSADSNALPKNNFWHFVPLENEENREELTFSVLDSVKNHGDSQGRLMTQKKRLRNPHAQRKRDILNSEKEESEDDDKRRNNNSQENFSSKTRTGSARYQSGTSDATTETPKILNMQNFPQVRAEKILIDERISNTSSARKRELNKT